MEESEQENIVNFEILFEAVRKEKMREELQSLPKNFYHKIIEYLKEQGYDRTNLNYEEIANFENIKKLIKDLYDSRERKIVNLALVKAKIENSVVDMSAMTGEEEVFFNYLVDFFIKNRENIIKNILEFKEPIKINLMFEDNIEEKTSLEDEYITVRILSSLPSFVGSDMNVYGPFKKEDITTLPKEIAEILIQKNRAEKVDF